MIDANTQKYYINRMAQSLTHFKWVGETGTFRCPLCGDSKKNKFKTRGTFYRKSTPSGKSVYAFKCFNCNEPKSFTNFMKDQFPELYKEYLSLRFKKNISVQDVGFPASFVRKSKLKQLSTTIKPILSKPIADLDTEHVAYKYFSKRMFPEKYKTILHYTENFSKYIMEDYFHGNYEAIDRYKNMHLPKDPRLIIHFNDRDGNSQLVQGRSLDPNCELRYITVRFDETFPKVYGLDRHDKDKLTLIVEGPFDSMMLPNCLAIGGVGLSEELLQFTGIDKTKCIMVYDNQPRNPDVVNQIKRSIELGVRVVIWNDPISVEKDINAMLMSGIDRKVLVKYLATHNYSGLMARLQLSKWAK